MTNGPEELLDLNDLDYGLALERDGDLAGAEQAFSRAAAGGDADAYVWVGFVRHQMGDHRGAEAAYRDGEQAGCIEAVARLGDVLREGGDAHGAEEAYERAVAGGFAGAAAALGVSRHARGDLAGAESALRQGDEMGDRHATYNLGVYLDELGHAAKAEACFMRAAERGAYRGALKLAGICEQRGEQSASEAWFRRMGELNYADRRVNDWWRNKDYLDMTPDERCSALAELQQCRSSLGARYEQARSDGDLIEQVTLQAEAEDLAAQTEAWSTASEELAAAARTELRNAQQGYEDAVKERSVTFGKARYLGGLPGVPGLARPMTLLVMPDLGVHGCVGDQTVLRIDWDDIEEISTIDQQATRRRVTAPRALALGPLAWVARKVDDVAHIAVCTALGEAIFEVPGTCAEIRAKLSPVSGRSRRAPAKASTALPHVDPLDRIRKLGELRDAGYITDEEFAHNKSLLLSGS